MRLLAFFCLAVLTCASGIANAAEPAAGHVLFIGIDGVRTDALRNAEAPHLQKLLEEGAYSQATQIIGPRTTKADTISGPGWSNLLTGVWPDKHGVMDNTFKGANYGEYPHVFTRVRAVRPQAKLFSVSTWEPIHATVVRDATKSVHMSSVGVPEVKGFRSGDELAAEQAVTWLTEEDPDLLFVYFGIVDGTGHKHGFHPTVEPYMQAIAQTDARVGQVLSAMRNRPHFDEENWLVLVSTDHGGKGTGHSSGQNTPEINTIWLIVNGAAATPGEIEGPTAQVDLMATALCHLGINPKPEWQLDGHPVGLKTSAAKDGQ